QLERDNQALSERATGGEATAAALTARIQELETALKAAGESRSAAVSEAAAVAEEAIAAMRSRAGLLEKDLADAQAAAGASERERAILVSRVADLEKRPDIDAAALERERKLEQARMQRIEGERLEAIGRAAEFEKELAYLKAAASSRDGLLDLENRLERAQKDAGTAAGQASQLRAERDVLATQATRGEGERAELRAEVARLEKSLEASAQLAASAQERAGTFDVIREELDTLRVELENERARSMQRQKDNEVLSVRVAQLQGEVDAAARAPAANVAGQRSIGGLGTPEELLGRIDRLDRRVLELESERNAARDSAELLAAQLTEAKQLRDGTLARFQDVVSQLNAVRQDRDRLMRANAALQTNASVASGGTPAAQAGNTPASGGFLDRFLASINGENSAAIQSTIDAFEVSDVDAAAGRQKATLDGRVVRAGEAAAPNKGLILDRIEGRFLIFKDAQGSEYRRGF
ncbi:MAG: hypothetical protein ACREIA_23815, partial [Opitutaceae bacterium]